MEFTDPMRRLAALFEAGGRSVRAVGGWVRDGLLGVAAKDVDFCTDASVDEMLAIARKNGFQMGRSADQVNEGRSRDEMRRLFGAEGRPRLIETGLKHGTLTFVVAGEPFEVTMLRVDVACDGRHAEVARTADWRADAARRDLTVNAMSMDVDGRIYDWFGGRDDLAARRIRLVGDPDARLKEDHLRVLRVVRFLDKFPADWPPPSIDRATSAAVARNVGGLEQISGERVWSEVGKILSGPRAAMLGQLLADYGAASVLGMPWTNQAAAEAARAAGASPVAMLASQIAFPTDVEALASRWRFSNEERGRLTFLVAEKRRVCERRIEDLLVDGKPRDWVVDLAKLAGTGVARAESFAPPAFPVAGKDLLAAGMSPGPAMGEALRRMRAAWMQSRFALGREALLEGLSAPPPARSPAQAAPAR